jgi:hypothetical protein
MGEPEEEDIGTTNSDQGLAKVVYLPLLCGALPNLNKLARSPCKTECKAACTQTEQPNNLSTNTNSIQPSRPSIVTITGAGSTSRARASHAYRRKA